jgi:hypothetical protein
VVRPDQSNGQGIFWERVFKGESMNMIEQIDAHADWLERQADKADSKEDTKAALLGVAWDDCLRQRDIDALIGGGYYTNLIEVLNDACSGGDQKINRECMKALLHCAAKGQIEAIEALDKVKAFFIAKTMEFRK